MPTAHGGVATTLAGFTGLCVNLKGTCTRSEPCGLVISCLGCSENKRLVSFAGTGVLARDVEFHSHTRLFIALCRPCQNKGFVCRQDSGARFSLDASCAEGLDARVCLHGARRCGCSAQWCLATHGVMRAVRVGPSAGRRLDPFSLQWNCQRRRRLAPQ